MFGDLIALPESVCFLLSLKQYHYGNPIDAYEKIGVNAGNTNVPVFQCYLYSCICIYSCNFLAFARNPFVKCI